MPSQPRPWTIERFMGRLDRSASTTSCWMWIGTKRLGYGRLAWGGRWYNAHRFSWELFNGPIPQGLHVLHLCDEPSCCNPDHLFLGTHSANMRDREEKGRHNAPRGSHHGRAKLADPQVREIRRLAETGTQQKTLARQYGISEFSISCIVRRKTWKHVD